MSERVSIAGLDKAAVLAAPQGGGAALVLRDPENDGASVPPSGRDPATAAPAQPRLGHPAQERPAVPPVEHRYSAGGPLK